MTKPSAIFFDWDGTLVDSFDLIQQAHNHALMRMELPPRSGDWFKVFFGRQRDYIYNSIYGARAAEAQSHFETFVDQNHTLLLKAMPGAQSLLDQAKNAGIMLCVVSNKRTRFIHPEVAHLGWGHYFAAVIGSGDAAADKPSAIPVYEAARKAGLTVKDYSATWYVGDTEIDWLTSKNAGAHSILIDSHEIKIISEKPDFSAKIVKNCYEIQEYLLQTAEN